MIGGVQILQGAERDENTHGEGKSIAGCHVISIAVAVAIVWNAACFHCFCYYVNYKKVRSNNQDNQDNQPDR